MASNRQRSANKKLLLRDFASGVSTGIDESIFDFEESISNDTDEYLPSETESESGDSVMETGDQYDNLDLVSDEDNSADEEVMEETIGVSAVTAVEMDRSIHISRPTTETKSHEDQNIFLWSTNISNFKPRMNLPSLSDPMVLADVNRSSTELEVFFKLFPKSLFEEIANYTNMRLEILKQENKRFKTLDCTSPEEIMVILGCVLVMSYNRLPAIYMYWSASSSLGNALIKSAIARDRFQTVYSKLYFNAPQKRADASKIYYTEKVMDCLRKTFIDARSDSTFQSIDESMTKFKGRSSLKQYMPMKPVKRGVKLWTRCDSKTGYVYDTRIYCGKENSCQEGTLGERVVKTLCSTIRNQQVALVFDRFFTSTSLMHTLPFPAIGTYMKTRKYAPKLEAKLAKGESEMAISQKVLASHWKDKKNVLVMSNCHKPGEVLVKGKEKTGESHQVSCPTAIADYNKYMGGVDLTDQMVTVYELDRKNRKWWRKVFFRMLMVAVHNSFIVFCETNHMKMPFFGYLVSLAEGLIDQGRSGLPRKRTRKVGRRSNAAKAQANLGDHFPVKENQRRRCAGCASRKKERRTKMLCRKCNVPLCMDCFTPYHT